MKCIIFCTLKILAKSPLIISNIRGFRTGTILARMYILLVKRNLTEIVAYKLLKQNIFFSYSVNTSDFASLVLIVSIKSYVADQIFHMPIPQSLWRYCSHLCYTIAVGQKFHWLMGVTIYPWLGKDHAAKDAFKLKARSLSPDLLFDDNAMQKNCLNIDTFIMDFQSHRL